MTSYAVSSSMEQEIVGFGLGVLGFRVYVDEVTWPGELSSSLWKKRR